MPQHLVAIVGRPNVGKSTLFNRITGKRHAIVHNLPGVTRDRQYAETDWAGKKFTIVDTGGFVPASEDVFETAIREQAQIAIDEADVVLFVVDALSGLLPMDKEIAAILRRSAKKVILVVNKADNDIRESTQGEFFALGLGDPVPASALVGRKIGDLLDLVAAHAGREAGADEADARLKVAVVGKPNVGKSSFVNAVLGENRSIVTDIPGTTRDSVDSTFHHQGEEIVLVDTAGLRKKSKITESIEFYGTVRTLKSIERCDVAVVLLDAGQGLEHQDLRIVETVAERKKGVLVAVNKWDLVEKDERTASHYEKALRERLRMFDYIPVIFISALTHQRVFKVIDMVKEIDRERSRRIQTSELNAAFEADLRTRPPQSRSGKAVRVTYVTQVETKPPVFAFFCNDPRLIDENYRRFLENRLRDHFGFRGVPLVLAFKRK